jgi:ankyrin repeat protein
MKHRNLFFTFIIATFLIVSGCAPTTPLIKASLKGDDLAVQKLIKQGVNINEPDSSGLTPLMYAIWSRNTEVAKHLIESGADINAKDYSKGDALIYAVDKGDYEITELLLDKGANINSKDYKNATPIIHAVISGDYKYQNEKIVSLLIKRGANLNEKDDDGYTPLSWALFYGKTALVDIIKKAVSDASKDMHSAKIVFIRKSNVSIPLETQDALVYIDGTIVASLSKDSTDYTDVKPGKCTMVIKGANLEGKYVKSFDAVEGQTYYFEVTKRAGSTVATIAGGMIGQMIESAIQGDEGGTFKITQLEESIAKEKIKAIIEKRK